MVPPVSVSVPARRPRSSTAATRPRSPRPPSASARRSCSTSPAARLQRAGGLHSSKAAPSTLYWIAPIPDLWPRFPLSSRSGWPDGLSLPRSSRRNAPRGPISSRSRNLRCAPIPRGFVLSFNTRGRRGGFATPAAAATALCCGPRYAAIWRAQARTISRRLAALATRPSATAPRRLGLPGGGSKLGGRQI